jgi:hypothetical protein
MNTTALLTLDAGSVLLNPHQMPEQVALKHKDAETILAQRGTDNRWNVKRRDEYDLNFSDDGGYTNIIEAIATLCDRQAFGFRLNGNPVNPLLPPNEPPESLEIEALDLGGYLFQSGVQLPVAIYTTNEVYYRLYENPDEEVEETVLERKSSPREEWEQIDTASPWGVKYLIETVAKETDMLAVEPSAEAINKAIEDADDLFKAPTSAKDDEIRQQAAIQDKTVFPPNHPAPRPVEFPTVE